MNTVWLFLLLVWVHVSDVLFQNRWGAFTSGLGLGMAVLTWAQRGRYFSTRWFIALWGTVEGLEIFVCQGAYVFFPKQGTMGQCSAYVNLPLYQWGLVAVAVLLYRVAKENHG